ncbi:S-layer homology domain-containing protein [Agathobaculum hominis]
MKKRVLSMFMALALCLTLLPTAAFAEGEDVSISGGVIGGGETGGEGGGVLVPPGGSTGEGGGIYVAPGSPTEGGGTYIPGEDTRTEIWRDTTLWTGISRPYDGTTDGSTIPITLTFTDGANSFELKEGTGFTAVKTFDSADVGDHTVTVEITLIGEAAKQYKLKAGAEKFEIGGTINKASPDLTVSLSKTICAVGEKLLPLLSLSGVKEDAAVTYYYTPYKMLIGDSEHEGRGIPAIDENTVIDKLNEEGNNTYYVYARTAATQNYQEGMSNVLEFTVAEKVDPVASVTSANGTETTYGSFSDAWTAAIANNGSTLKLLADATLPNGNTDLGQSLTLDLNGYVLGSSGSLTVKSGAALTVRNAGAENSEKQIKAGLYLTILVEKGGSFTCTDGSIRYLGLQAAGTGDYSIKLAEGENHCAFGGFAQGDANATIGDLLKATPGMALYGDYNGSDVRIERSTRISSGFTYLSFYVGPCSEHKMDANGTCIYCGASYVASVTASGGESTNYTSLDDALDAVKDGDTVMLLSDAEVTKWHSLSKAFTLELNGKTVTTQSKAELYLYARVIVQDSSTGKTGGMAGTALLNVQSNGDLTIQSGTFNGRITINDGKLTIKGGTFNQEVDLRGGDSDSVFFSGGTFANIWYPNSSGSFLDLLADGYAFYDNDVKLVNAAEITGTNLYNVQIRPHQHTFTKGACACGYTCPHTSVDESGACTVCGKQFAASITEGKNVTYYDTFGSALFYATRNDGCTLKLLADVTGTTVQINNPFIFDLNGHSVDALSVDAKATIKDSGTTKGRIGKVTVSDTKVPGLTLGGLLEEGYAFQYENGSWANDSHLQTSAGLSVTVRKAPIQSVAVYAKDKNHKEVSTIAYGTTGEVTLVSSCRMGETSGADLSYLWYKLEGLAATAPLEGATGANYTLPDNLTAGTHTYLLICTSDGYSKSAEITVTVTPVSLEDAEVTVQSPTYNGKLQEPKVTVKLGDKTLSRDNDYTMEVTKQTDAGSYKLTIKGGGNYTGTIEKDWKIEPMKIDSVMVSSDISKTYDGTATVTKTAEEWAKILTFKTLSAYAVVDVPSGAYTISDAYFVEKSGEETIHSPDAGEKYGITFKITLNDDNYVLQTYGEDTPSTSKVITQSGGATFTIKQATVTSPGEITQLVFNDLAKTYTIDLPALPALDGEKTYGDTQYAVDQSSVKELTQGYNAIQDVGFAVNPDNGKTQLTFHAPAVKNQTEGSVGAIKITVTPTNYEPVALTVKLQSVNKRKLGMFVSVATDPIVYGMTLGDIKLSADATVDNQVIPGTIVWEDPLTTVPAAGQATYRWTFTPDDTMHYLTASNTITFSVDKATPTGAPTYTAITTGGKTLADAALTANAGWPSGTVQWVDKDGKPLPASTQVQANTEYTWSFTPADAANYNGATGSVTLYAVSSGGGGGGGSSSASKTSTTTNADGSVTKTETKSDGTVVETTTGKDGSTTKTETKKDGSSVTESKDAAGSTGTVKTDKHGQTTAETALSSKAIEDAKKSGEAVKAPVEVEATRNSDTAPTVKIELPRNSGETKVEIPVSNVKPGTVAVLVHPDGTEEIVKNSLPTEDGIQLTVNGGATVKIVDNSKDFIDTRSHWAKDAIDFVSARGLVSGMSGTTYAPDASTNRAQLWTMLARQNDADLNGGATWFENAQNWAKEKGISDGTNPDGTINRAQMVTMLWRAMGQPAAGGSAGFADVPADSYYASAVAWAVENGITDGVGGGLFDPTDTCTRAQIATFLYRLYLSR